VVAGWAWFRGCVVGGWLFGVGLVLVGEVGVWVCGAVWVRRCVIVICVCVRD